MCASLLLLFCFCCCCPDSNNLVGTFTSELSLLQSMQSFSVFNNVISGIFPDILGQWSSLQSFDLERNRVEGPLFPSDVSTMATGLESYRVSSNRMTGGIPHEGISRLSSLRELWLAGNEATGTIPATIGDLSKLGTLACLC